MLKCTGIWGQFRAEDIVVNVEMASKVHGTSGSFSVPQVIWPAVTKTVMAICFSGMFLGKFSGRSIPNSNDWEIALHKHIEHGCIQNGDNDCQNKTG